MVMNEKQFRIVSLLARENSFAKAAGKLNVSQPYLVQTVKKIESEIGARLFERAGHFVRLTDAGKICLETCEQVQRLEKEMASRLALLAEKKTGSISIGISPFRSIGMLPRIAARFKRTYPGVFLEAVERSRYELLDGIAHGEFDLCITTLPVDERLFHYQTIAKEEVVLAVPQDCVLSDAVVMADRKFPAIDARLIDGEDFVEVRENQMMQRELESLCLDLNISVKKAAVVQGPDAQIAMVREGIGMSLIPTGVLYGKEVAGVRLYSLIQDLPKRDVVIMWRKERKPSDMNLELIRTIREIAW